MDECVILVDNSNIYIEGAKHSARTKGILKSESDAKDPQDPSWRIDFSGLLRHLAGTRRIHSAVLAGSRPPPNDGVWKAAEENGFDVFVHDRGANNQEKAVDTELTVQGAELIVSAPNPMTLVIASGDRDFIPLVTLAHRRAWTVEMCAFSSAFSETGEMATTVDVVRPLEEGFEHIGYNDFDWPPG